MLRHLSTGCFHVVFFALSFDGHFPQDHILFYEVFTANDWEIGSSRFRMPSGFRKGSSIRLARCTNIWKTQIEEKYRDLLNFQISEKQWPMISNWSALIIQRNWSVKTHFSYMTSFVQQQEKDMILVLLMCSCRLFTLWKEVIRSPGGPLPMNEKTISRVNRGQLHIINALHIIMAAWDYRWVIPRIAD